MHVVAPHLDMDGIEKRPDIHLSKRSVLPLLELRKNLVGDVADKICADVHGVLFGKTGFDFPSG